MKPRLDLGAFRNVGAAEHAIRFAFGGSMTAVAGMIAHAYGPEIGGLFLAFPAILPASLTLVARHDGRRQAADEARGAVLGATALVAFAAVVRWLAEASTPPVALLAASATWLATAVLLWALGYGLRREPLGLAGKRAAVGPRADRRGPLPR